MKKCKRETFVIPDSGKSNSPMRQSHFWNWLETEKPVFGVSAQHNIEIILRYVESLGFDNKTNILDKADLEMLKIVAIENYKQGLRLLKIERLERRIRYTENQILKEQKGLAMREKLSAFRGLAYFEGISEKYHIETLHQA